MIDFEFAYIALVLTTGAFFIVVLLSYLDGITLRLPAIALVLLVAVVYLVPAWMVRHLAGNTDIENFHYTARLVRAGSYVYAARWPDPTYPFHPYLPFEMFVAAAADWFHQVTNLPFSVALKAPNIVAVGATALLLRSAVSRIHGSASASLAALVYILNPVVVGVTAYHGQFDAVSALLAFGAWFELRFARSRRDQTCAALLLGFAILSKSWPLVLLPVFLAGLSGSVRDKMLWVAIALAVPAVVSLSYSFALHGSVDQMIRIIRGYSGIPGLGGWSQLYYKMPAGLQDRMAWVNEHSWAVLLPGLLVVTAVALAKQRRLEVGITMVLVGFFVFAPASTPEYFVWLLPFAIVSGERVFPSMYAALATVARCSLECYGHYWGWAFVPTVYHNAWILGAISYGIMVVWLCWLIVRSMRSPAEEADPSRWVARSTSSTRRTT